MAAYFGLQIEYLEDPEVKALGFLDPSPEPRFIAVRRGLEPIEEEFTIAHELGHYLFHPHKAARRITFPLWNLPLNIRVYRFFVRAHRLEVHKVLGCEPQADIWAIAALHQMGRVEELLRFVKGNLGLSRWLLLIRMVSLFRALPQMVWFSFLAFARALIT